MTDILNTHVLKSEEKRMELLEQIDSMMNKINEPGRTMFYAKDISGLLDDLLDMRKTVTEMNMN